MKSIPGDSIRDDARSGDSNLSPVEERSALGNELAELLRAADDGSGTLPLRDWVDLAEAWYITRALRQCRGNRSAAARALGIGRRTLYAKMEKLGIQPTWSASGVRAIQTLGGDTEASAAPAETPARTTGSQAPLPRVALGR